MLHFHLARSLLDLTLKFASHLRKNLSLLLSAYRKLKNVLLLGAITRWLLRLALEDYRGDLERLHRECCHEFEEIYELEVETLGAINSGLRLLGALSLMLRFTSDVLGFKEDLERMRELVRSLKLNKSKLDVAGLMGLTLLCENLKCREFKWARKQLSKVTSRRKDLTPQLAESSLALGRRSHRLISSTPISPCITLLESSSEPSVNLRSLGWRERKVVRMCLSLKEILASARSRWKEAHFSSSPSGSVRRSSSSPSGRSP